jgi:glycerol-3-phosphate O-acyltransferase/dihydroxyacetone phosphate acyltransferase
LNYFNADKFRSRAVVEFGRPLTVPAELVEMYKRGGEDKKQACSDLLSKIHKALRAVTVNTPDYEVSCIVVSSLNHLF